MKQKCSKAIDFEKELHYNLDPDWKDVFFQNDKNENDFT